MVLGAAMTIASPAGATCPDLSDYGDFLPQEIRFQPSDQLPIPTGVSGAGTCSDTDPEGWCADVIASAPNPSGAAQRDHLFVWFPGVNNRPHQTDFVPKLAAFAGYRTINLAWDNFDKTRLAWCAVDAGTNTLAGGYCDDGCMFSTGQEMLDGVDVAATDYEAVPVRSITVRLAMALEYLHKLDIELDGTNDQEWASFCSWNPATSTTSIDWGNVEVGGFSMGASMASYISYVAPGVPSGESIGMLALDAGADTCEWPGALATPTPSTSADYYPDEYDDPSIPPCGGSACSDHNRFVFTHDNAAVAESLAWSDTMLEQVGVDSVVTDVDALIAGSFPIDFEDPAATGTYRNLLNTSMDLGVGCGGHSSMGADACAPVAVTGGTLVDLSAGDNASDAYLAPAWLSAVCQLDSP